MRPLRPRNCRPWKNSSPNTRADPNGPALLTINLGETAAEISGFLAEIGIDDLPVAMDINEVVKRDYGVQNLPTTFVIDGEGFVRHLKLGEMKYEDHGPVCKSAGR